MDADRYTEFIAFLKWALPQMRLQWSGFRKVRGTVRKRIARRMAELGICGLYEYRAHLESHADEWTVLDAQCRIPTSRFYRDRAVFDFLGAEILPERARAARQAGADDRARLERCSAATSRSRTSRRHCSG